MRPSRGRGNKLVLPLPWLACWVVALGGAACVGGDEGSRCRETSDCAAPLECSGPDEPQGCGIPPREECDDHGDCGTDAVCHALADVCSPDGVGSSCGPPCADDPGCGPGFRCGPDDACEAVPCDDGYACAAHEDCDPSLPAGTGPVHARTQGCVSIACADDDACPDVSVCVNRVCQRGLGACVEVIAVP